MGKAVDQEAMRLEHSKQPLLISACLSETPNMAVVRTLVEDTKVNVNARVLGSMYRKDG